MFYVLVVLAALTGCATPAEADHDAEKAFALDVARVCANEAFGVPADCALIYQVVEGQGRSVESRHGWLRRHSSCATRQLPTEAADARLGNCGWARNLMWDDAEPAGWPESWSWDRHQHKWARTRRLVWAFVTGQQRRRPCVTTPATWGGRVDIAQALDRGLVPVDCEGTVNTGFLPAP